MVPATNDEQVLLSEFTLTRRLAFQWAVVGTAGMLLSAFLFGAVHALVTGSGGFGFSLGAADLANDPLGLALAVGFAVVLATAVIGVHELIHGAAFRYYGGRPRYGVGVAHYVLPYAYATADEAFTRNRFLVVALAPLVVISVVGVALMALVPSPWWVVPLSANAGGAIGDVWMAATLLRYPASVRVVDHEDGLRLYGRPEDAPSTTTADVSGFVTTVAVAGGLTFGLVVVLAAFAPVLFGMLGLDAVTLGFADGPWFLLRYETAADGGFTSAVGLYGAALTALVVGVAAALVRRTRGGRAIRRPA